MTRRFLKPKTWVCVGLLAAFALLLWAPIKKAMDVAAVQNAVQRDWEITFGSEGRPSMLPSLVDAGVESLLGRMFASTSIGYPGRDRRDAKLCNRSDVYHERFRAMFRPPIELVDIYNFEAFRGDLGAALARFPALRRVSVVESDVPLPTVVDWTLLSARLRALPQLEEIELGGEWVTDAAIAPLAGHQQLRSICIRYGRLTTGCTKTFASIPHLAKLVIEDQIGEDDARLSSASQAAMRAALPAVSVELP